mmetsp:Transcript_14856/g.26364  ORF Transcript_14856/g.26364 Transcript_14856/m.26364 type:complete len:97 (+) Transcript_14856:340-630(+)
METYTTAIDVDGEVPATVSYTHFCLAYADAFFGYESYTDGTRRATPQPDAITEDGGERGETAISNAEVRSRLRVQDPKEAEDVRAPLLQTSAPMGD